MGGMTDSRDEDTPSDPRVETPIRADKLAVAYRRRLSELGITYGVIPTLPSLGQSEWVGTC